MKFIHTADLHLDTPFSGLDTKLAQIRRDDLRKTFSSLIELVKSENAEALLISGDFFDGVNVSKMTLDFIISKFAEIKDVKVLICAGNHDPKDARSYYNLLSWGENVHIFDTKPEIITVNGVNFCGVSFGRESCDKSIFDDLNKNIIDDSDILLMHCNYLGEGYNPVSREFIQNSGLKYIAAGHIHKHTVHRVGNTTFSYPGCIEGRGFDELEKKGANVVEITDRVANVNFYPLCQREYLELTVSVSGLNSYEAIIGKILMDKKFDIKNLYKIILVGECEFLIDLNILKDALTPFYAKFIDKTTQKIDLVKIGEDFSIKGIFVKKMLDKMKAEGETDELKRALDFGLAAISGEKVNP